MKETPQERRLAENEVIFRSANQKVVRNLEETRRKEREENIKNTDSKNIILHFYCECADDKCSERIKLTLSDYESIHFQSNVFVIKPGHEVPHIERITKQEAGYYVVQKFMTPPKNATKLHSKSKNLPPRRQDV